MVILADKNSPPIFQCSSSLYTAALGRLSLTWPRLSAGQSVVCQVCEEGPGYTLQGTTWLQTAEWGVQPRADQSKHTNETLIGLYFRSWLTAPSFPSLAHWHAPCPDLSASFKTVHPNNFTVASSQTSVHCLCSGFIHFYVELCSFSTFMSCLFFQRDP